MINLLDILLIIISILLIILILLQQRGGSFGSIFGYFGTMPFLQRRGIEKHIYYLTWILAILFILFSLFRILL